MASYDLSFTGVSLPTNSGGASVTIEEDPDTDGTYENSDTVSLSDGVTSYTTSTVFNGSGDVRLDFSLGPPSDVTVTSAITFPVDVTVPTQQINVTATSLTHSTPVIGATGTGSTSIITPNTTLTHSTPNIAVDPISVSISTPTTTLAHSTPYITVSPTGSANIATATTTLTHTTPTIAVSPAGTASINIQPTTLNLETIDLLLRLQNVILDLGDYAINSVDLDYQSTSATIEVDPTDISFFRLLDNEAGSTQTITEVGGGFRSFSQSTSTNKVSLQVPDKLKNVVENEDYLIDSLSHSPTGSSSTQFGIDLGLLRKSERSQPTNPVNQTANANQWEFDLNTGTIATESVLVTSVSEQDQYSLQLTVDTDQAATFVQNPTKQDAVAEYQVPNGDSFIEDNSDNDGNTVHITPPSQQAPNGSYIDGGAYIITDWRCSSVDIDRWVVDMTVRPV